MYEAEAIVNTKLTFHQILTDSKNYLSKNYFTTEKTSSAKTGTLVHNYRIKPREGLSF